MIDILFHLDAHLNEWIAHWGLWSYLPLFLILFCETGLVVTPFLPGDSLLFAVGAVAATDQLSLPLLGAVLILAAVLGDAVNYAIGYRIGPKVFRSEGGRWLNKKHLLETRDFYEQHGGKTIFLARFVPILRTFAPFVAGVGRMSYRRFAFFNVSGALSWVLVFLLGGYFFGAIPLVKENFELVILMIVFVSLLPLAVRYLAGC